MATRNGKFMEIDSAVPPMYSFKHYKGTNPARELTTYLTPLMCNYGFEREYYQGCKHHEDIPGTYYMIKRCQLTNCTTGSSKYHKKDADRNPICLHGPDFACSVIENYKPGEGEVTKISPRMCSKCTALPPALPPASNFEDSVYNAFWENITALAPPPGQGAENPGQGPG